MSHRVYRTDCRSRPKRHIVVEREGPDESKRRIPRHLTRNGVGFNSAAQLLLSAGDNPERLKSEASFAALCGVSPVSASSRKTTRHRLNRGGDHAANNALQL
ncbi:transposase IS116/IS110/IS902 family protein [Celeribacter baekdonensis B30]|uniref:Transposase IS116/IS110/IS902 family protein n=1 Tax=Celeribacter baekdonensis B30 TaxID=1208323 RepID=K2JFX2_9RHOB|nr:transposase IS116/IS110/IS902 family protein [Celeribacter baekdonensis B30]